MWRNVLAVVASVLAVVAVAGRAVDPAGAMPVERFLPVQDEPVCGTVEAVFTPDGAWTDVGNRAQIVHDVDGDGVITNTVDTHVAWLPLDAAKTQAQADAWIAERDAHVDGSGAVVDGWDPNLSEHIMWGTPVRYENGRPHLVRYLGEVYSIDATSSEFRPVLLDSVSHWSIRTRCVTFEVPPADVPPATTSTTTTSTTSTTVPSTVTTAPPTTVAAPPGTVPPTTTGGTLPATGVDAESLVAGGLVLLGLGGATLAGVRRFRRDG